MSAAKVVKEQILGRIKEEVNGASVVLFADFRGLTVGELTHLRRLLKKEGGRLSVYKNTLTRRALDELNIAYPSEFLVGPSAVIHSQADAIKLTKVLVDFKKEVDKLSIKGGILDNGVLSEEGVTALAQLPGREELLAQLVGSLKSPLNRLVASISGPTRGLVYVLSAIQEKKQEV